MYISILNLNDVLDVRDGTHDSPVYYDEGFPLITSKNLKNGQIIDDNVKYISRADYEKINDFDLCHKCRKDFEEFMRNDS